ncbi:hypothetical protein H0H93_008568 [Arthromyces matolae]|nr:hypothetical protein H0H93_008568 [Arthromyces matolae]
MINDDDLSDLTELDDSDEEDQLLDDSPPPPPPKTSHSKSAPPTSRSAQKPKKEKKKLSTDPRLDEPHLQPTSVETLFNELQRGTIDVNPEYQRGEQLFLCDNRSPVLKSLENDPAVVWLDDKQGQLIDSLMHRFVVFPLVFAERRAYDGTTIKICIDGKQRITAIQRFINGEISYIDSELNKELWFKKVPTGRKGQVLTRAQQTRFLGTMILTCKYSTINENDEREVFQRVQNGITLTSHERLKAVNGPNCDLVREMFKEMSEGLRISLGWDGPTLRGKDFFMVSQIACMIKDYATKGTPPATQPTINRVETFFGLKTAPSSELKDGALQVIKTFNYIHEQPQLANALRNIQPQWFIMAGFMIFKWRSRFSVPQLADAITKLKAKPKAGTSPQTYKSLLAFVMKEMQTISLKDEPLSGSCPTPPVSTRSIRGHVTETPASNAPSARKRAQPPKRKRYDDDDDDDVGDGEYSPVAGTQLTSRRKARRLTYREGDDDDNSDDDGSVACSTRRSTKKTSAATPKRPLSAAVATNPSPNKAQTKVRPKSATAASAPSARTNRTQVAKPSIIPGSASTRKKTTTTAGAVSLSPKLSRRPSLQSQERPAEQTASSQVDELFSPSSSLPTSMTPRPPSSSGKIVPAPNQQQAPSTSLSRPTDIPKGMSNAPDDLLPLGPKSKRESAPFQLQQHGQPKPPIAMIDTSGTTNPSASFKDKRSVPTSVAPHPNHSVRSMGRIPKHSSVSAWMPQSQTFPPMPSRHHPPSVPSTSHVRNDNNDTRQHRTPPGHPAHYSQSRR